MIVPTINRKTSTPTREQPPGSSPLSSRGIITIRRHVAQLEKAVRAGGARERLETARRLLGERQRFVGEGQADGGALRTGDDELARQERGRQGSLVAHSSRHLDGRHTVWWGRRCLGRYDDAGRPLTLRPTTASA